MLHDNGQAQPSEPCSLELASRSLTCVYFCLYIRQVSSETDLGLGAGAARRGGAVGRTFEYSLGDGTLLVDLALQSAHRFAVRSGLRR